MKTRGFLREFYGPTMYKGQGNRLWSQAYSTNYRDDSNEKSRSARQLLNMAWRQYNREMKGSKVAHTLLGIARQIAESPIAGPAKAEACNLLVREWLQKFNASWNNEDPELQDQLQEYFYVQIVDDLNAGSFLEELENQQMQDEMRAYWIERERERLKAAEHVARALREKQ